MHNSGGASKRKKSSDEECEEGGNRGTDRSTAERGRNNKRTGDRTIDKKSQWGRRVHSKNVNLGRPKEKKEGLRIERNLLDWERGWGTQGRTVQREKGDIGSQGEVKQFAGYCVKKDG